MFVFIDYETFYDEKSHYSLRDMPTLQYIRDPRFKVLGMSFARDMGEIKWIDGYDNCKKVFDMLAQSNDVIFVAHNASFDACVAKEVFGYEAKGYCDTMFMARYLISQGVLPYDTGVALKDLAKFVDSEKLNLDEALEGGTLDTYAIRDTELCRKFFYKYKNQIPPDEMNYMDTHVKMSALPKFVLDEKLLRDAASVEENKQSLYPAVRKDDFLAKMFERLGVTVEYKTTPKGNSKPAFAKTDDFMKKLLQHPDKRVAALAQLRLDAYSSCERSKAQRFLDVGSPLACPLIYYGAHCLTGDAEVLTPSGWVRLDEWNGGLIMQVDRWKRASFLPATRFVGKPTDDWVECNHPYMKGLFTSGHKLPVITKEGKIIEDPVASVRTKSVRKICTACTYTGTGNYNPDMIRVLVMAQADGHFETNKAYGRCFSVHVRKERKKERARTLLKNAGIKYRELSFKSHPEYTRFVVSYKDYPEWFTEDKKVFGAWLLDTSAEAREAFCEELFEWDGYKRPLQREYYSVIADNVEWAQTIFSLCGYSTTIRKRSPNKKSHRPVYGLCIRLRDYLVLQRRPWSDCRQVITPYCAVTKTGFFLVRYKGSIFVTGNTGRTAGAEKLNVQNMPRGSNVRVALRAPEGYRLVIIDSSQVEVRVLGFLAGENKLLDVFRRGEDIYKHFGATELFHKPIEEITKAERQMSKPPVLAAGYGQSGVGLAAYAKRMGVELSPEMAEQCVMAYRAAYPAITGGLNKSRDGYWQRSEQFVKDNGYSLLPSGRKLMYPNLRFEQGGLTFDKHKIFLRDEASSRLWHGTIVENNTQATARDLVFWQIQRVLLCCPTAKPALAVHDEAVFVVPEDDAEKCLSVAEEAFKSAPSWAQGIPVQGEGHISDCYDK